MKMLNFHERAKLNQGKNIDTTVDFNELYRLCFTYYDEALVNIYENTNSRGELSRNSPYRIHIRTDVINPELLCALEQAGLECRRGATCNEWETSLLVLPNYQMRIHPPHMSVKLQHIPDELRTLTPLWYDFLKQTDFLGHLMGTMSNGITVPKQAFGECQTSIVLETYRRAYGPDYKAHQCTECINYELQFKEHIVNHDFGAFEEKLNAFVNHFINVHPDAYKVISEEPFSFVRHYDDQEGMWFKGDKRINPDDYISSGRYGKGYL